MTNIITALKTDSMKMAGHMIEAEAIIGTVRTSVLRATSETIRIEMIQETLRIETDHMMEKEAGINMTKELLEGAEVQVDLKIETGLVP